MLRRRSLAQQFLVFQSLIVVAVLIAIGALSVVQTADQFRRVEGRRALLAAENLAALPAVRAQLLMPAPGPRGPLAALGESVRTQSGASDVALTTALGVVVASSDPDLLGEQMPLGPESDVLGGASWTGVLDRGSGDAVVAHAPIQDDDGTVIGAAVIERDYPSWAQLLRRALPTLLVYLGVATLLGLVGSLLLARRVKHQTLGLEPEEIVALVEQREATLHGLKEGVLATDLEGRLTIVNDSALELLGLTAPCVGRKLDDVVSDPVVARALSVGEARDQPVLVGDRALTVNRRPVHVQDRLVGSVVTFRDRTEVTQLSQELGTTRTTSEVLRAQTHEFSNQLHTIAGLIELGDYAEVLKFVEGVTSSRASLYTQVTSRIADPTVAALLIAKTSQATERGVRLLLDDTSHLDRLDEALSRDVTTVLGNLIDNAIDAVAQTDAPLLEVLLNDEGKEVEIVVSDNGPGIDPAARPHIFEQGWSSKQGEEARGYGLAIARAICRQRGGDLGVESDEGAVFTAVLHLGSEPT